MLSRLMDHFYFQRIVPIGTYRFHLLPESGVGRLGQPQRFIAVDQPVHGLFQAGYNVFNRFAQQVDFCNTLRPAAHNAAVVDNAAVGLIKIQHDKHEQSPGQAENCQPGENHINQLTDCQSKEPSFLIQSI